jgi:hypothetical protein
MIDKYDSEVPFKVPFQPAFKRHWDNPQNDALFKKRSGGLYLVQADLRGVNIPIMLNIGHKHHAKLGPKVEIIGAGDMTYSEWAAAREQVFQGEPYDDAILRVDLTADCGVPVGAFERAIWCKHKLINQHEYGEWDHKTTDINRLAAQTIYYGRKPHQIRIYDKTLHRAQVLLPKLHRQEKRDGVALSTFFEAYGYESNKVVTRVERQMGARETAKAWGIATFGDIQKLAKCDPFQKLQFGDDARGGATLDELDGHRRSHILLLRRIVENEGVDAVKVWLRQQFKVADSYRRFWRENEHLIIDVSPFITRGELTQQYQASILQQLAA